VKKLIRVELEYDDGSIKRLTGDNAHKWNEQVSNASMMAYIHGSRFELLSWEETRAATK